MFYDVIKKISWDETTQKIMSKTDADVRRALSKSHLSVDDFMALVSPAADKYLEQMARLSRMYTRERFGKTINMFIPIYITNSCSNSCVYCGFHVQNKMPRTVLTEEEIVREYEAIKKLGPFDNLLVLTGENPAVAGVKYIARALDLAKPYFNNLQIEVMPLRSEDYAELRRHGLNGVICFQETYNEARYKVYHPRGPKSNYEWRLNGYDRMGQAGVHKIGMGALIGLEDWRTEVTMMAYHLRYLEKTYWRTQYSVNFPRMRRAENGGFQPNVEMTDRELAQVTLRHAHLRPRRGHIVLHAREPRCAKPHGHARRDDHERREPHRPGRLRLLSQRPGAVPRERRAHRRRGGPRPPRHRHGACVEELGRKLRPHINGELGIWNYELSRKAR